MVVLDKGKTPGTTMKTHEPYTGKSIPDAGILRSADRVLSCPQELMAETSTSP